MYDYIIVGGGPTGIILSIMLENANNKVAIIESESMIGGCWKTRFANSLYYTEHSPKVIVGEYPYFDKLLDFLKLPSQDRYDRVYGNWFYSKYFLYNFIIEGLNLREIFIFTNAVILARLDLMDKTISVEEWLKKNKFSKKGYKTVKIFSVIVNDVPNKLLAYVFFRTFKLYNLFQLKQPNEWLIRFNEYSKNKNIDIFLNTPVISIKSNEKKVKEIQTKNKIYKAKKGFILCIPPYPLQKLLEDSDFHVKNNWMNSYDMKQ